MLFRSPRLLPWRSVVANVALPLELAGVPRRERLRRAAAMLDRVQLGDALRKLPGQLSGGMRMRTAIARALVTGPELLLLDETAREEEVVGEAGPARGGTVGLEDVGRLARDVHHVRHARLHPVGEFVLRDSRIDFRISNAIAIQSIQLTLIVEHVSTNVRIDPRRI